MEQEINLFFGAARIIEEYSSLKPVLLWKTSDTPPHP